MARGKKTETETEKPDAPGGALAKFMQGSDLVANMSRKDKVAALKRSRDESTTGQGGGFEYLTFSGKVGKFKFGRDKRDLEDDDVFIIDPSHMLCGWNLWIKSKVAKKHRWSAYDPEKGIDFEELEEPSVTLGESDGWKQMMGFAAIFTGSETPKPTLFETDSKSGVNVVGDFIDELIERTGQGAPDCAVISFGRETFEAHDQTNWKPILEVEAWITSEEVTAYVAGDTTLDEILDGPETAPEPEPEPEAAPRRRRRKAA